MHSFVVTIMQKKCLVGIDSFEAQYAEAYVRQTCQQNPIITVYMTAVIYIPCR
jgi:hypothetical protein